MKTIDRINQRIKNLPEKSQKEVLNFVDFLLSKTGKIDNDFNISNWNQFSLDQAMNGLEEENIPLYNENDIKENLP